MSSYYGGQQPQMSVNQQLHQSLCQMIDQMTQQVDQPSKQALMNLVQTNQQWIIGLHQHVFAEAARMGVNMAQGQSLHQQDLARVLHDWIVARLADIRRPRNTNMGYAPQLGFNAPNPNALYSSGAQEPQQPVPPPPPPPVAPQQTPSRTVGVSSRKVITPMQVETLEFNRDPIDDETRLNKAKGLEIIGTPMTSSWNQARVSYATLKSMRVEDGPFDAYRDMDKIMSDGMKRGLWAYRLIYTDVKQIPVDTKLFLTLREKIRACFAEEDWRGVLRVLQDTTQGVWSKLDSYLTARLNVLLESRLRSADHIGLVISITTIADLQDLCDPHFSCPFVNDPHFISTLEKLINSVMKETFIHHTVVIPEKNEVTPLMKCRAVDYFDGITTKFDYGILPTDLRAALLEKIFAENTVLKLPRVLIATNAVHPDTIECLSDPNFMGVPDQLGLFQQLSDLVLADEMPLPDTVVLNRPRVAPSEWINCVKPIFPMGTKTTYLVGSNRLIGW